MSLSSQSSRFRRNAAERRLWFMTPNGHLVANGIGMYEQPPVKPPDVPLSEASTKQAADVEQVIAVVGRTGRFAGAVPCSCIVMTWSVQDDSDETTYDHSCTRPVASVPVTSA